MATAKTELKMTVEDITPELAKEYLKHNTNNYRKLSRHTFMAYAEDMKNGKWQTTGVPIVFDVDGVLKDGQHRLAGIIFSKTTVRMTVVRNVAKDVDEYDTGKKRTNMDILQAEEVDADSTVIAAANILVNRFNSRKDNTSTRAYVKSHIDELNRAKRIVCYGTGAKNKNAPSVCAAYLMLRTESMPSYEIELFFRLLNDFGYTGADGYEASSAIIAQRMMDERGNKNCGYQIQKERLEILIMAMQDFHAGKKVTEKYKIAEPFQFMSLMTTVRKEDGLED